MHMFMFYNFPEFRSRLIEVEFTEGEASFKAQMIRTQQVLARKPYEWCVPTCTRVELYERHGNDWVFVDAWAASRSRTESVIDIHNRGN